MYLMRGLDASFDAVLFISYHGSIAQQAIAGAASITPPDFGPTPALEVDVRTTDIAEAMTWVRVVERKGAQTVEVTRPDTLSTFRSFAAAILLSRTVAEIR
jgi:D-aminopeptidase